MSSCSRRTALLALASATAACGFTPLYAPGSPAASLRGRIALAPLEDRFGFLMREQLETRLGAAENAEFLLTIATRLSEDEAAIRAESGISRINLSGRSVFTLTPLNAADPVLADEVRAFTAYNTTASPFAADVAKQEAERRVAIALADQIVLRITATAGDWSGQ